MAFHHHRPSPFFLCPPPRPQFRATVCEMNFERLVPIGQLVFRGFRICGVHFFSSTSQAPCRGRGRPERHAESFCSTKAMYYSCYGPGDTSVTMAGNKMQHQTTDSNRPSLRRTTDAILIAALVKVECDSSPSLCVFFYVF